VGKEMCNHGVKGLHLTSKEVRRLRRWTAEMSGHEQKKKGEGSVTGKCQGKLEKDSFDVNSNQGQTILAYENSKTYLDK